MKILSIGVGFISAVLLCGQASAVETDYAAGTRALPLQQAGGTARAAGMGSAVIALPQGSASLLWNPAALSLMNCSEVGLHHNTGLGDTIQEIAVFGMPLGQVTDNGKGGALGGIAASFGYVNHGSFKGRDVLGNPTGNYQAGDFSGSVGWGRELVPGLSAGIALKGNRSRFGDKSYNAFATDIGFLWHMIPSMTLGLTYSNIKINWGTSVGDLVSGLRVGGTVILSRHVLLAATAELQKQAMDRLQVGVEYLIGNTEGKINVLALRGGYQVNFPDPQLTGLTGLTLGMGYTLTRSMALDYAMVPTGELGTSHRLSLTQKFNCPGTVKPVKARELTLRDTHFDSDKAILTARGMKALRKNIKYLQDNPKAEIKVTGYTSRKGTEESDSKLSERRAAAVREFLLKEGVAPGRITTAGYSELHPKTAAKSGKRVLFTVNFK